MAERGIAISLVVGELDEDILTAEPLLFPEILGCEVKLPRLRSSVRGLIQKVLEKTPALALHRRELAGEAHIEQVKVSLDPPKRRVDWVDPVDLLFHIVRWRHGNDAHLAFVPALGIEVVAARESQLAKMVCEQILNALRRTKAAESLYELALLQRMRQITLESTSVSVSVKSPKQTERDADKETKKTPAIEEVGLVLDSKTMRPAYQADAAVQQIAQSLIGRNPRSVLLVGASGIGKTAAVHELVRTRSMRDLGNRPFWSTSGSRLVAGMSGFGMWQQRCQRLCKEAEKEGAVLLLGNLVELMEVGRGGSGGQGIAGFLRPYLARGEVLAIAECTPQQLPLIEREDPHLLEVFHSFRLEEPNVQTGRAILLSCARAAGWPEALLLEGWLDTLDRLHRRYATYSAYPGRPVRFLENLLKDRTTEQALIPAEAVGPHAPAESRQAIGPREVVFAFSRETGLPLAMLDPAVPLDLEQARQWFAARVIGQDRAVNLVNDLLATVKTALARPRKPVASLLFVGPTGVGKTEMAKSLAEYFFGDRNRLARFDMSEFAGGGAVQRLIGGAFGAQGLLTAKVREQPFSVILFDEFEKAHWSFFDLLLQILGEGRLTDAAGRLGDFSNAIIVMTSNLGAEGFGRGAFGLNQTGGSSDAQGHFTDEVRAFLRPELFNRIDRVVPFMPLDEPVIQQIAARELKLVEQRDGLRLRGVTLEVISEAAAYLTRIGYDPKYGARPLKRAIERELLAPLAEAINAYPADIQLTARAVLKAVESTSRPAQASQPRGADSAGDGAGIGAANGDGYRGGLDVIVKPRKDASGNITSAIASGAPLAALAQACALSRRQVQKLERCAAMLDVQNQLFLLERLVQRETAKGRQAYNAQRGERIRQLHEIADPAAALSADIRQLEDQILAALYGNETLDDSPLRTRLAGAQTRLEELLLELLALQVAQPTEVTVGIFGIREHLFDLARAYESIARSKGCRMQLVWFSRAGPKTLAPHPEKEAREFLAQPSSKAIGVAMRFSGAMSFHRFHPEAGIHEFILEGRRKNCLVHTSDQALGAYDPPADVHLPDLPAGALRREYNLDASTCKDIALGAELRWAGKSFEPALAQAIEKHLRRSAWEVLDR